MTLSQPIHNPGFCRAVLANLLRRGFSPRIELVGVLGPEGEGNRIPFCGC